MEKNEVIIKISLIALCILTIAMSSIFMVDDVYNPEGDTLETRFYLLGPDSYYNMRLSKEFIDTGHYMCGEELLNYPLSSSGSRPPLFTYITVAVSNVLEPFLGSVDALGWSMLLLPAIYGGLIVFPLYGIGKEIFNKKVGMICAIFLPITPLMVAGAHGSMLGLFDHDSFVFLLFTLVFLFYIKTIKNDSYVYPIITGVLMGLIMMTWIAGQTIFAMFVVFLFIQLLVDLVRETYDVDMQKRTLVALLLGTCIALTVNTSVIPFLSVALSIAILGVHIIQRKYQQPCILTVPIVSSLSVLAILSPFFNEMRVAIFGDMIYGSKIDLTIAEGSVLSITDLLYGFGPILYWCMFAGFIFFMYKYYHEKFKAEHLFLIILFVIFLFFTTRAGRFISDAVPLMILLASFFIYEVLVKVDWDSLKKLRIRPSHTIALLFIVLLLVSNAYLSVSSAQQRGVDTERRWSNVCYWLSQQDTEIEYPVDRPAILTWWDYGFFIASMGEHPTVADNFQSGLYVSSNFFTSTTELEALSVLVVRIIEGTLPNVPESIRDIVGDDVANIIENPKEYAWSYDTIIEPEWHNFTDLKVSADNARYWDSVSLLMENRTVDDIFEIYCTVCNVTGKRIKYVGVDEHDLTIFSAIAFTADKGVWYYTGEDDYNVGVNQTRKDAFYNTMCWSLSEGVNLKHFKQCYHIKGVRIFEIS